MAIEIREKLTDEIKKIKKGTREITIRKAFWDILKDGKNYFPTTEIWVRDKDHEERQTTAGTGVPVTLRKFTEMEHKSQRQKARGIITVKGEVKGDGKELVLIILTLDGEDFIWNRDTNKGRAIAWAKGFTQAFDLYMDFPMKASNLPFENTDEKDYQESLAYRGKERTLVPSSYKKKEKEQEGILADMQEGILITKEETEEGITIKALQKKSYKELQEMAKEVGIKANQKREELEKLLLAKLA